MKTVPADARADKATTHVFCLISDASMVHRLTPKLAQVTSLAKQLGVDVPLLIREMPASLRARAAVRYDEDGVHISVAQDRDATVSDLAHEIMHLLLDLGGYPTLFGHRGDGVMSSVLLDGEVARRVALAGFDPTTDSDNDFAQYALAKPRRCDELQLLGMYIVWHTAATQMAVRREWRDAPAIPAAGTPIPIGSLRVRTERAPPSAHHSTRGRRMDVNQHRLDQEQTLMQHEMQSDGNDGAASEPETESAEWRGAGASDDDHSEELEQLAFEADIRAQMDQSAAEAEWHAEQEEEQRMEASRQSRRRDPRHDPTDLCSNDDWHPEGYIGW